MYEVFIMCSSTIDLQNFFPIDQLKITNISEDKTTIKISLMIFYVH